MSSPTTVDILPDSRPKRPKGAVWWGTWWIPIFCANCGADGGKVPEENMNFVFYLCPTCFESHGTIAHTYAEPDKVFWDRVRAEQLEKYQRLLTKEELQKIIDDGNSPLATLLKKG